MIDLTKTTAPKTDQLNFDDMLGGKTLTIKVTKVSLLGEKDQPIAINFEGDNGKPYKPCLSMRRVLVHAWGSDGTQYVGRSMTLYGDPKVKFGGVEVGGIRISHLSNIEKEMTMALTASKASRKPFTVRPLGNDQAPPSTDATLIEEGNEAAKRGTDILKAFWSRMKPPQQKTLASHLPGWKETAAAKDEEDREFNEASAKANILSAG